MFFVGRLSFSNTLKLVLEWDIMSVLYREVVLYSEVKKHTVGRYECPL